jgi:alpha-beta hydrolase superfamily lysophospholipase
MFKELFKGLSVIYKKESIAKIPKALPIHSFCGSDDPVGGNSKGPLALVARLQNAGINNVTSHVFEDMRHECLNEIGNDVVMKHVYEVCKNMI